MGLTLLAQASLPLTFWTHVFGHAVHLINRLPTPVLQQKSPYECVFLGVAASHKGYKCIDQDGRIFISRHIVFNEELFPFQKGDFFHSKSVQVTSLHHKSVLPMVMGTGSSSCNPPIVEKGASSHLVSSNRQSASSLETMCSPIAGSSSVVCHSSSLGQQSMSSNETRCASLNDTSATVPSQPVMPMNVHSMQTRSKNEIFKPKALATVLIETEPATILEAFQSPAWSTAAH